MRLGLHPAARKELLEIIRNYAAIDLALGTRFRDETQDLFQWVKANPRVLSLRLGKYRRLNYTKFPYYLPYIIRGKTVWILAVAHSARKPHYWISRI